MRQAQESEIIRLTMDIRAGKSLELFKGNEVQVIDQKDIVGGMYGWADQIIVAKNQTRRTINNQKRKMIVGTDDPAPLVGDRLICLRNDWEHPSAAGDVMVNGTTGILDNIKLNNNHPVLHPMMLADFLPDDYTDMDVEFSPVDLYFRNINMDYKLLTTGEETVTKENFKTFPKFCRPQTFDYAYAITCWKAQGSEYDKVLVFEENFPLKNTIDHQKYLYTAATRAKKRLIIVRNFN